jgi:hypothetical protein
MLTFKRVLLAFGVILAALLAVGFLLPRQIHVERTAMIDAPAQVVFANVNDLRRWEAWTPWDKRRDPTIEVTYSDPAIGKGAWFEWMSEKFGNGRLEIIESEPDSSIDMHLALVGDSREPAKCRFLFEPGDGKTRVTWYLDTDMGVWPPGRYLGLFVDKMLGGDYEQGLATLKLVCEAEYRKSKDVMPSAAVDAERAADATRANP